MPGKPSSSGGPNPQGAKPSRQGQAAAAVCSLALATGLAVLTRAFGAVVF